MCPGRSGGRDLVLHIIDADASVREALARLAGSAGFVAHSFSSIEQFAAELRPNGKGCVLLDSSLLGGGDKLKATLERRGVEWPVIVLCPSVDDAARHEARVFGARFLLNKPVDAQALFDSIAWVTDEED